MTEQLFFVSDAADQQAALNAGIPASQLRYTGTTTARTGSGYEAPTGLQTAPAGSTGVYVGAAASQAPTGAQVVAGGNRAQTQQMLTQYAPTAASTTGSAANLSATGVMQSILGPLGLSGELGQWALDMYAQSGDWNYVSAQLPSTPQFQARLPAWDTWVKEGHTAAQYVDYENSVYQSAHAIGLTQGLINQDTITSFINNHVSSAEATQRFQDAAKVVNQLPAEDVAYFQREVGLGKGDLAAYFIDPQRSLPLLEQKVAAAQVGGAASRAGIDLGQGTANSLALNGVSAAQAQQGFGQMANDQQLFAPLAGQQGDTLSQDAQAGAVFGLNAQAAQQVAATAAQRKATFQAGGGYSSSSAGFTGVGSSKGV